MSIKFNDNGISPTSVNYNGYTVHQLYYNNQCVWCKKYALHITRGEGISDIKVGRTGYKSPDSSISECLNTSAGEEPIYDGDTLAVTVSANVWYTIDEGSYSTTINPVAGDVYISPTATVKTGVLDLNPYVDGVHQYLDGIKMHLYINNSDKGNVADFYDASADYGTTYKVSETSITNTAQYKCISTLPVSGTHQSSSTEIRVDFETCKYWTNINQMYNGSEDASLGTFSVAYNSGDYVTGKNNEDTVANGNNTAYGNTVKIKDIVPSNSAKYSLSSVTYEGTALSASSGVYTATVKGQAEININYDIRKYTITYLNGDGSTFGTSTLKYESSIAAGAPSGTPKSPTGNNFYHYVFASWSGSTVTKDEQIASLFNKTAYWKSFTGTGITTTTAMVLPEYGSSKVSMGTVSVNLGNTQSWYAANIKVESVSTTIHIDYISNPNGFSISGNTLTVYFYGSAKNKTANINVYLLQNIAAGSVTVSGLSLTITNPNDEECDLVQIAGSNEYTLTSLALRPGESYVFTAGAENTDYSFYLKPHYAYSPGLGRSSTFIGTSGSNELGGDT